MPVDLRKLRDEILAERLEAEGQAADASQRAGWNRVGQQVAGLFNTGAKPDDAFAQSLERRGQQALAGADRRAATKLQGAELEFKAQDQEREMSAAAEAAKRRAAEDAFDSPETLAARSVYAFEGAPDVSKLTARQIRDFSPTLAKRVELAIEAAKAQRLRDQQLADRDASNTEWNRRNAILAAQRLREAEVAAGRQADKQPTVPAGEAAAIGGLDAADSMLDRLDQDWNNKVSDLSAGLMQYVPGTRAAQYTDKKLAAAQAIGTVLEEGKLTDSDLKDKYLKLVPDASDSVERKNEKINELRAIAREKKAAKVRALTQAGYKTKGFDAPPAPVPKPRVAISPDGETLPVDSPEEEAAFKAQGWVIQ